MYRPEAPSYSILQMLESQRSVVTHVGRFGDELQRSECNVSEFLETLTVVHGSGTTTSATRNCTTIQAAQGQGLTPDEIKELREELAPWEHLSSSHSDNGAKNYWIADLSRVRSRPEQAGERCNSRVLFAHQMQPKIRLPVAWHAGDLAFWDNERRFTAG